MPKPSKSISLFLFVTIGTIFAFAQNDIDDNVEIKNLASLKQNPYNIPEDILPLWDSLSIRQKASQLIMVYMSPADFLIKNEFGGVLVMKSHLNKKETFVQNLTEANAQLRIPLLVASDQEGGARQPHWRHFEKMENSPQCKGNAQHGFRFRRSNCTKHW